MKIKLHVPEGFEIDKGNSTFEEIVFKPIKKIPTTWYEYVRIVGNEKAEEVLELYDSKAMVAFLQLIALRDYYREGWVPPIEMGGFKYCVMKYSKDEFIVNGTSADYLLSFQNGEIAKNFLSNFKKLIKEASRFIFGSS